MRDGVLQYNSRFGTGIMVNMSIENREVTDGQWHNVTLLSKYRTLRLLLDDEEVGDELDMSIVHDFLDPYLTSLTLGGVSNGIVNLYDNPSGTNCFNNEIFFFFIYVIPAMTIIEIIAKSIYLIDEYSIKSSLK